MKEDKDESFALIREGDLTPYSDAILDKVRCSIPSSGLRLQGHGECQPG